MSGFTSTNNFLSLVDYHCQVFKNIEKHILLSDSEKHQLAAIFQIKNVSKNEKILEQGKTAKKIYFVESGSLRAFHTNRDGKESTIMFAVEDWWITDMDSFINQKPAQVSIEALGSCRLIALDFVLMEALYIEIPKLERFFRILFQKAYVREQQRVLDSISFTTEERYNRFVTKYPQIVEKVTQKQIASYLGVTPEFLSSVKKK